MAATSGESEFRIQKDADDADVNWKLKLEFTDHNININVSDPRVYLTVEAS